MALTVVETVGASNANSYVTVAEATAYLEAVLSFSATWVAYTSEQQKARVINAARAIDRYQFVGAKADLDQSMQFPRSTQYESVEDPVNEIPAEVKAAQIEMIIAQAVGAGLDATTGQAAQEVESVSLDGVMSVTFGKKASVQTGVNLAAGGNVVTIEQLLRPWLLGGAGAGIAFIK